MKDYKNNYSIVPVISRNFGRKFYQVRYNPRGHYFDKEFNNEKEAKKFINCQLDALLIAEKYN